jgi:hypothetical protein
MYARQAGLEDSYVHFITFANTEYMKPVRILEEAEAFEFDSVRTFAEHDIPDFIKKHKDFIKQNSHGYGKWIWKPKIILDRLLSAKPNDVVVYCDAGMHLNAKGVGRYVDYLKLLTDPDTHMVVFSVNDLYRAQNFVKLDAIAEYCPEFALQDTRMCYAGVMMLRNTPKTVALIRDWLGLCENYHFLDGSLSIIGELPGFKGNDCDNGLFNLCLYKHGIAHAVYPDETNLYDTLGNQAHMWMTDWSSLDAFPFQCRRLRPR